jgi:hypothetical protein
VSKTPSLSHHLKAHREKLKIFSSITKARNAKEQLLPSLLPGKESWSLEKRTSQSKPGWFPRRPATSTQLHLLNSTATCFAEVNGCKHYLFPAKSQPFHSKPPTIHPAFPHFKNTYLFTGYGF